MNRIAPLIASVLLAAGAACAQDPSAAPKVTHVAPPAAAELLKESAKKPADSPDRVTVLDIRTPEEFAGGHLEGAKNIDFKSDGFAAALAKLDRDKPYLVHCQSGRRSTNSLKTFAELGFTRVYHLDGGIKAWQASKQPVVRDGTQPKPTNG
jgi:rhodanese-related sulfurtransferase